MAISTLSSYDQQHCFSACCDYGPVFRGFVWHGAVRFFFRWQTGKIKPALVKSEGRHYGPEYYFLHCERHHLAGRIQLFAGDDHPEPDGLTNEQPHP